MWTTTSLSGSPRIVNTQPAIRQVIASSGRGANPCVSAPEPVPTCASQGIPPRKTIVPKSHHLHDRLILQSLITPLLQFFKDIQDDVDFLWALLQLPSCPIRTLLEGFIAASRPSY